MHTLKQKLATIDEAMAVAKAHEPPPAPPPTQDTQSAKDPKSAKESGSAEKDSSQESKPKGEQPDIPKCTYSWAKNSPVLFATTLADEGVRAQLHAKMVNAGVVDMYPLTDDEGAL